MTAEKTISITDLPEEFRGDARELSRSIDLCNEALRAGEELTKTRMHEMVFLGSVAMIHDGVKGFWQVMESAAPLKTKGRDLAAQDAQIYFARAFNNVDPYVTSLARDIYFKRLFLEIETQRIQAKETAGAFDWTKPFVEQGLLKWGHADLVPALIDATAFRDIIPYARRLEEGESSKLLPYEGILRLANNFNITPDRFDVTKKLKRAEARKVEPAPMAIPV